jgi:hypothetical protein
MERTRRERPRHDALPPNIQDGIKATSGHDLDDVVVHRNSAAPAAVGALAYTQGNAIHLAPGQEHHLAHEAWHVVQQREGRVPVTGSVAGVPLNDDRTLESEADRMGAHAAAMPTHSLAKLDG